MNTVWVLVCDSAKSRVFEVHEGDPQQWHIVELTIHAESRAKASELATDHLGQRSSEGGGVHHNALAPGASPKEVEKEHFLHSLVTMLDQALRTKRFYRWVLVAPPHVAGVLKKDLTPQLEKHLLRTVDKDYNQLDVHELAVRLHDDVRIPPDQREVIRTQ
jgi:protein required for attachment to host cells